MRIVIMFCITTKKTICTKKILFRASETWGCFSICILKRSCVLFSY